MLLSVSSAGSFFYYWDALGLSPRASCFLSTHALVISFSLLPTRTICRLVSPTWTLYLNARLLHWTACSTPACGYLIDTSNLPYPSGTSDSPPDLLYPKLSSLCGQRLANSILLRCKDSRPWSQPSLFSLPHVPHAVWQAVLLSLFSQYIQNLLSPHLCCFSPALSTIISHVNGCKSHLTGCLVSFRPSVVCCPLSCQNDSVRPRVK